MMNQNMLINALHPEEFRIAVVENQLLEGFFLESASRGKIVGNIYKGTVVKVQPSLQAAFVNYGVEKHGFLPFSEIHPEYYQQEMDEKARKSVGFRISSGPDRKFWSRSPKKKWAPRGQR